MLRIIPLLLVAGCFDSLVDNPCIAGYELQDGQCVVPSPVDEPDVDTLRPPTDNLEPTCTADTQTDPFNCGACGRECASGICEVGHCVGSLSGHVIAIGHDYGKHNAAMARVLGNAVALGSHHDVAVARWRGTAPNDVVQGTSNALAQGMAAIGRPWHGVATPAAPSLNALDGIDVLVVDAQTGDGDALAAEAAAWAPAIDHFLQNGGVTIVLAGAGSTSHRFAAAADLYAWGAPVDASSLPATISDAADAVAQQVVSPYLTAVSSVAFPNVPGTIVTQAGSVVIHQTRY
jgi:hypothetical protein